MKIQYSYKILIACLVVVLLFLTVTYFKTESVVSFEQAMDYITLKEDDKTVVVNLNCTKGTVYVYSDAYYGNEGDNIYVVFKQSAFDRLFGKKTDSDFRNVVINKLGDDKSGYTLPTVWYIEDERDPNAQKQLISDRIIPKK